MDLNNYCVLPFNSVSISATGEIRQCCNAGYTASHTNISNLDINGIINNTFIQDIRQSFINDEKHSQCDRCWKMEDLGTQSFRHIANSKKEYNVSNATLNTKKVIDFADIQYIDITLGNKCNLACRMCNWTSSSLLAKQLIELEKHSGPVDLKFDQKSKDKILDLFRRSKNLKSVYMLGGEPLINTFHDEILDLLIESGQAKDISIHYNTNLQVNKIEDYLEKWNYFKRIIVQASIDGCDEVYEYIRWPGNWNKVYKNLITLVEKSDDKKIFVSISTTIQNINAINISKLIETCQSINGKEIPFFFIPVVGLSTLDLTPKNVLSKAITKLESLSVNKRIPIHDLLTNYYSAYNKDISKDSAIKFFEQQKMFDKKRNQNLFNTIPYFKELAEICNIERW